MALDKVKTNFNLGKEIHRHLVSLGVETPIIKGGGDEQERLNLVKNAVQTILSVGLNLDLSDDSLKETPNRVAKMYLNEVFWGLNYAHFPKITTICNKMQYNSMLLERGLKVHSFCEHHLVTIVGEAYVAYIPNEKVIGLSKINRIVEFFSRRPQVQERLTEQIFHTLQYILETDNVAVLIKAEHFCVKLRGVEDINSDTITSRLGGAFLNVPTVRGEFYNLVNGK